MTMRGLWTAVGCFLLLSQALLCEGAASGLAVDRWLTKTQLKYAACSVTTTKPGESIVLLNLKHDDQVLAQVTTRCPTLPCTDKGVALTTRCPTPPCTDEGVTLATRCPTPLCTEEVVALATRGLLGEKAAHLLVAWEPSINLDLDDGQHTLSCTPVSSVSEPVPAKGPDPVRTIPATKRTWRLKKSPGTEDSALVIEVGGDQKGWKPIVNQASLYGKQSRGSTGLVQFYNSTAESDDMTILKVVNTADVFSLTVVVSQNSTLPADSDKWRCNVKVGGDVKSCTPPSSEEETLPSPALSLKWFIIIVASLAFVIIVLLILLIVQCSCRQKTKTDSVCYCCQKRSSTEMLSLPVQQTREDDDADLQKSGSLL